MTSGGTGVGPDDAGGRGIGAGGHEGSDPGAEARHQTERVRAEAERQAERARAEAHEVKDEVEDAARRAAGTASRRTREAFDQQKAIAADEIASLARALRASADQLAHEEHGATARYLGNAAAGIDRMGDELRRQDFTALMHQTERFARAQPALFMGGAFAAGFALVRFLKSSAERRGVGDDDASAAPRDDVSEAAQAGPPPRHATGDPTTPGAGTSGAGKEGGIHGNR